MSVTRRLFTALQGRWSTRRRRQALRQAHHLEAIRQAMLDSLHDDGSYGYTRRERSLLLAPDAEALWHLRPELLAVIGANHGERAACVTVGQISAMFDGLLPRGLLPRHGGLRA